MEKVPEDPTLTQNSQAGFQTNQPTPRLPMGMGPPGNGRNPRGLAIDHQGQRKWAHGLCGCTDDFNASCLAFWCPCVIYGKNYDRLTHLRMHNRPHPTGGDSCGSMTWVFCATSSFLGAGWVLQLLQRSQIRGRYSIAGNGFEDCCGAFFCTCCQQVQDSQEIQDEETYLQPQSQSQQI
ncbi:hypothetical protein CROQUDRAFT_662980 [Cronartium quercuum f. sp. fusiforme G11]|uniref:Uncharacterized protein n=1 Tax=Cronartium quercuum f. sp. fusiforme G11 TaxID=708437 RepID=A0A9P6NA20_9BASI|nr:hypothetical protein CROQUDRAFT_662980 [Cronartium quercuum f. sp. fusiforme G11]